MSPAARNAWSSRKQVSLLIDVTFWIVDRLRRPLGALGIDFVRFRAILELKLRLDLRPRAGVPGLDAGLVSGGFAIALSGAWLIGILPGVLAFFDVDPLLWMAVSQAVLLGVVVFFLLAQYGPMLVDATDVAIVAPLPVPDRTLFAARLAHVAVYVSMLAACTAFWPAFLGPWGLRAWVVPLVVVACSIGTTLLGVAAVGILYGAVLRLGGPASFQRFAFWVQVAMLSGAVGGLQAVQAVVPWQAIGGALEHRPWLGLLAPPVHSGAVLRLALGEGGPGDVLPAALAAALPLAALWIALRLASRHFVAGLAGDVERPVGRGGGWPRGPLARLAPRVAAADAERAGYGAALGLCRRDRVFLRAALPGMAPMVMLAIMSAFLGARLPIEEVRGLAPLALWLLSLVPALLADLLRASEHARASWMLRVAPLGDRPRGFLRGAVRGALALWLVPALALPALALCVARPTAVTALDVLVAGSGALALGLGGVRLLNLRVPFSWEVKPNDVDMRNLGPVAALMATSGLAAGAHALLRLVPGLQAVALVAIVPGIVVGWRRLARLEPVEPLAPDP